MMIVYKLWYVTDSLNPAAHHGVMLQESPHILCGDSRPEWPKESSADYIDASRRNGPCLLRIPGQSLSYLAC